MIIYFYNMVKTYRRRYRRYRYNRSKIMRNYFKAKLDVIQKVLWTSDGVKFVSEGSANSKPIPTLLELCPDWATWRLLFHSFKLTGIAVEVAPNYPSARNGDAEFTGAAVLALLTSRDAVSWNNASEANFMFMLSPTQVQRKYKSFFGGLAAWTGTDTITDLDGKFVVESDGNPSVNSATAYTVRFTFYITFKNSN